MRPILPRCQWVRLGKNGQLASFGGKPLARSIDTSELTHHNGPMGSFGEPIRGDLACFLDPSPRDRPLGSFGNPSLASFGDRLGRGCEKRSEDVEPRMEDGENEMVESRRINRR